MQHSDILKILDIDHRQLSPELLNVIKKEVGETYTDRVLNEHIYNAEDTAIQIADADQEIYKEFETLYNLASENDCAYFRIIFV